MYMLWRPQAEWPYLSVPSCNLPPQEKQTEINLVDLSRSAGFYGENSHNMFRLGFYTNLNIIIYIWLYIYIHNRSYKKERVTILYSILFTVVKPRISEKCPRLWLKHGIPCGEVRSVKSWCPSCLISSAIRGTSTRLGLILDVKNDER